MDGYDGELWCKCYGPGTLPFDGCTELIEQYNHGTSHGKGDKRGQRVCAKERIGQFIVDWCRLCEVWHNENQMQQNVAMGMSNYLKLFEETMNILNAFAKTSKAGNRKIYFREMKTTQKWHLHKKI